ncbi:hypothetical protein, partial [Raoultella ornithinolytica]|uniref:hypothetical protein n=1 Tax=Raoultella ornithinolytica TaxID=54291 RepID=UPI003D6E9F94
EGERHYRAALSGGAAAGGLMRWRGTRSPVTVCPSAENLPAARGRAALTRRHGHSFTGKISFSRTRSDCSADIFPCSILSSAVSF